MGDSNEARGVEGMLAEAMKTALEAAEAKVDKAIETLERSDDDELDRLRAARKAQLMKLRDDRQMWIQCGHGEYSELSSEKDFFPTVQRSKLTVVHFYRQATVRCNIVDKHMKLLAPKHYETRFVKVNAEKCPFLVEKLVIKVLPTILVVIDGQIVDRIVGFTDLGNCDDFTTEVLEWRLGVADGIHYSGDKTTPPFEPKKPKKPTIIGKNIRGSNRNNDSDSETEEYVPSSQKGVEMIDLRRLAFGLTPEQLEKENKAADELYAAFLKTEAMKDEAMRLFMEMNLLCSPEEISEVFPEEPENFVDEDEPEDFVYEDEPEEFLEEPEEKPEAPEEKLEAPEEFPEEPEEILED